MIFLSVPRGTNTPSHSATFTPGNPDSAKVGTSGKIGSRLSWLTARIWTLSANGSSGGAVAKTICATPLISACITCAPL